MPSRAPYPPPLHRAQDPDHRETLNSVVFERCKRDVGVDDMAALAPCNLYFDGRQVASNATAESLRDELRLALDPLSDEVVGVYRGLLRVE